MTNKSIIKSITDETWGFTLQIKNISGGSAAMWKPSLKEALHEIELMFNHGDYAVTIIQRKYKDRFNPYSESKVHA